MARRVRLKTRIITTHMANPTWSSRQIADALRIPQSRVTAYASRYQLKLPRGLKKRPEPKPRPAAAVRIGRYESCQALLRKAREYLAARPPAVRAYLGVAAVTEAAE